MHLSVPLTVYHDSLHAPTFLSAGISLVMLVLLRYFVGVMVWTVVFLVAVGSIAGTGFCWYVVVVRAHVSVCACRWPYSFCLGLEYDTEHIP